MARRFYPTRPQTGTPGAGIGVEIVGIAEVQGVLAKYQQPELDRKITLGLKAAGRKMSKSVRSAAPARVRTGVKPGFGAGSNHRSGDLYRSIASKTLRGSPPAVAVGPVGRHSSMRHLAIRTTKAHLIRPYQGAVLEWAGAYATAVHHPGNHAHPWVATGISRAHDAAMRAAANAIFRDFVADPAIGGDD